METHQESNVLTAGGDGTATDCVGESRVTPCPVSGPKPTWPVRPSTAPRRTPIRAVPSVTHRTVLPRSDLNQNGQFYKGNNLTAICPVKNVAPVANAGPGQTVTTGTTVTLNGSGSSDADGNPLTYLWSFVSIPAGSGATLDRPHDGQTNLPGGQNRSVRRPTHRQRRRGQQHTCDSDDYHHTG